MHKQLVLGLHTESGQQPHTDNRRITDPVKYQTGHSVCHKLFKTALANKEVYSFDAMHQNFWVCESSPRGQKKQNVHN